ncbi:MAG: dTMP kinase [Deltaproteobacteria bacterium]|nr:dTMP kinase [Deltaproteobacteria bacterium]
MPRGLFVTFEGVEGAGKSTQIGLLAACLQERGVAHLTTMEPGGTPLGVLLRRQLLNDANIRPNQMAELFLFCADRAQHLAQVIIPALSHGRCVLCDRFTDSTLAYQGYARGIDVAMIKSLCAITAGEILPDATFLLDIPAAVGLERVGKRKHGACFAEQGGVTAASVSPVATTPNFDGFEAEELSFHQRVREGFLRIAAEDPQRVIVIDGLLSTGEIAARIKTVMMRILER